MELDDVADELYGLRPQEFTAARDEEARRARAGGQQELAARIRSLRRPTLAAWASNVLVREQGEQVAPLLRLGEELRGAHRNLDGAELRALSHQQHQLVNALTEQAGRLAADAGQPLGPQARHEVAQTLHAVLADPDAAREWAAGRLSKPLTAAPGFEAAAREAGAAPAARERETKAGAGARPGRTRKGTATPPRKQAPKQSEKERKESRGRKPAPGGAAKRDADAREAARAAREAAAEARRRRREADEAAEETAAARAERDDAEERIGRLREEVREAEEARKLARRREKEAERAERAARRRAEEAEAGEERARRRADGAGGRR